MDGEDESKSLWQNVPTAEPRPQEEDVKDHVKQAWEEVKVDLTGEDDDDEQMQDDDDVTMKSPQEEAQPEEDDDDRTSKKNDINDERRDFREQDEVDEFLNEEREQAERNDDEETEGGEINIEEYEADEAHDAEIEYPAWLKRIEFGSKVLPVEPCMIGDAQPELIKVLLLQIGLNILRIYKNFHRNFCGTYETAWQHFQLNQRFRLDLDPKVPYLGEDADGNLIEPTGQQMRELYCDVGKPDQRDDIGEEGFVNAYYGAIVFKRLVTYTLECGYTFDDLQNLFVDENIAQLAKGDTTEEEMRKAANAREALDRQATLVRRIILQVPTRWTLCISSGMLISRTQSHWIQLTSCVHYDRNSEEYRSCTWSFKMADSSLDLYSRNCMMQSKTTTTSNNVMINGQGGVSTCLKPTWLQLPILRCLLMFDVNATHHQQANRKQHRSRAM